MSRELNLKTAIVSITVLSIFMIVMLNSIFNNEKPPTTLKKKFVEGKSSVDHGFLGAIYFLMNQSHPYSVSMITNNGTRDSARHQIIGRFDDLEEAEAVLGVAYHIHTQDKYLLPKTNVRLRGVHHKANVVNETKHEDHLRRTF